MAVWVVVECVLIKLFIRCSSDGISRAAYTTGQEGTGGTGTTCYLTLMLTQVILFLFNFLFLWICVLFVRDSWVANQIKLSLSRILAWEDGFCNFAASACDHEGAAAPVAAAAAYTVECAAGQEAAKGLQPELFFKMSHDIYNYGEGYVLYYVGVVKHSGYY
jgi:hypothetical protein